jgi:hypothetical protein
MKIIKAGGWEESRRVLLKLLQSLLCKLLSCLEQSVNYISLFLKLNVTTVGNESLTGTTKQRGACRSDKATKEKLLSWNGLNASEDNFHFYLVLEERA